jgi:hypothetical protein
MGVCYKVLKHEYSHSILIRVAIDPKLCLPDSFDTSFDPTLPLLVPDGDALCNGHRMRRLRDSDSSQQPICLHSSQSVGEYCGKEEMLCRFMTCSATSLLTPVRPHGV